MALYAGNSRNDWIELLLLCSYKASLGRCKACSFFKDTRGHCWGGARHKSVSLCSATVIVGMPAVYFPSYADMLLRCDFCDVIV